MSQDCSYNELYALQVLDESMEPEFPKSCVIVIEPSQVCASGAFVVATVDGEHWFRQYLRNGETAVLRALNSNYPDIPLVEGNYTIDGVIVQRNVRRQIKHYKPYQEDHGVALE